MIELRFITQDSFISWAIRTITWSPWSHVEIIVPTGFLGSQVPDGVQLRPFNYCVPTKEAHGIVQCSDEVTNKVISWAMSKVGCPYDYTQILGDVIHQIWAEPNTFDCSQFVATAFAQAGFPLLDTTDLPRITPGELALSPLIRLQLEP